MPPTDSTISSASSSPCRAEVPVAGGLDRWCPHGSRWSWARPCRVRSDDVRARRPRRLTFPLPKARRSSIQIPPSERWPRGRLKSAAPVRPELATRAEQAFQPRPSRRRPQAFLRSPGSEPGRCERLRRRAAPRAAAAAAMPTRSGSASSSAARWARPSSSIRA